MRLVEPHRADRDAVEDRLHHALRVGAGFNPEPCLAAAVLAVQDPGDALEAIGGAVVFDHDRVASVRRLDVLQAPAQHRPAVLDQADRFAHRLDFLHPVGREDHGRPPGALLEDELFQQTRVDRVEPAEWFVEDDQLGFVNHRGRELHLLLHAFRQLPRHRLGTSGEAEALEPAPGAAIGLGQAQSANGREERELLAHFHPRVEPAFLREISRAAPDSERVARAEQLDKAIIRLEDAECRADRRGLAGSVRSEQAEDGSGFNRQVEAVHRARPIERLEQLIADERVLNRQTGDVTPDVDALARIAHNSRLIP